MGETSGYEIMAETKAIDNLDADINEFLVVTKVNPNTEVAMNVESVEALINENIESNEPTEPTDEGIDTINESHVYFEENLNASEEVTDNLYNECFTSVMLDDTKVKEEWINDEYFVSEDTEDMKDIKQEQIVHADDGNSDDNSDEETIATFITSAGQQLALYAVEDSEEVFAVAVYSESGEPPTNFQFLMKADVERLIGEGAVRTVKKPQQMKKQTYQGELITPRDNEIYKKSYKNSSNSLGTDKNIKHQVQHYDINSRECFTQCGDILLDNRAKKFNVYTEEEDESDINEDLTYQDVLDSSYFLLEQGTIKQLDTKFANNDSDKMQEQVAIRQIDDEITEQSTVQNILYDDDESDSELTFDEIKRSMQHFDKNKRKSLLKMSNEVEISSPEKAISNGILNISSNHEVNSLYTSIDKTSDKSTRRSLQSSSVKHKHAPNALLGRKSLNSESRQTVFIQGSTALICCPISDLEASMETSCKESSDSSFKIKRPRKQQLTIVNRADSEIIIQPASMVSDEEEEPVIKKRGRRKKRRPENLKNPMKTRSSLSKRISSNERRSMIEIIEIDVENEGEDAEDEDEDEDDEDYVPRRRNIEEVITIEDGKEKGSSDKENEVIMVGDSDDDDEVDKETREENREPVDSQKNLIASILKCDHCGRSFRQKRALETHSSICPKSPNSRRRLKTSRVSTKRPIENRAVLKKQYVCKFCQEKFDVVVALARHVRSHYKKKETIASVAVAVQIKNEKKLPDTNTLKDTVPVVTTTHKNKTKRQLIIEQKSKDRLNVHRGWNSDNMSCIDCGRWFAGAVLLSAHRLQHATKKSGKRIKRCQICRKLFRSRLIYIRHMHMHSNAKQLQKRIKRTRQSTNTTTTLRKRGRPRKL